MKTELALMSSRISSTLGKGQRSACIYQFEMATSFLPSGISYSLTSIQKGCVTDTVDGLTSSNEFATTSG